MSVSHTNTGRQTGNEKSHEERGKHRATQGRIMASWPGSVKNIYFNQEAECKDNLLMIKKNHVGKMAYI